MSEVLLIDIRPEWMALYIDGERVLYSRYVDEMDILNELEGHTVDSTDEVMVFIDEWRERTQQEIIDEVVERYPDDYMPFWCHHEDCDYEGTSKYDLSKHWMAQHRP